MSILNRLSAIFLFSILVVTPTAFSQPAEVEYTRTDDGRTCWGTCLKTKSDQSIVATVAHCIPNLERGGVNVNGIESTKVFVASSVRRTGGIPAGRGGERGVRGDDFALLVFPKGVCTHTVTRSERGSGQGSDANGNLIPNVAQVFKAGRAVEEVIENYSDDPSENVYLTTTNNAAMTIDDGVSGSGLYSVPDPKRYKVFEYLGPLMGCSSDKCRYFSATEHNNPAATDVLNQARDLMTGLDGGQPDILEVTPIDPIDPAVRSPIRAGKSTFTCTATCLIEYRNPSAIKKREMTKSSVRGASSAEASTNSTQSLTTDCEAYCGGSRDAVSCTLEAAPNCS